METQPFNQEQREGIARMLVQAKERAQNELESDRDIDRRVESELMPKLVELAGATELVQKTKRLLNEAQEARDALERRGFDYSYGRATLKIGAPAALSQFLETAQHSARMENRSPVRKFELAILGVWAAETAEDARKIVEGLL